MFFIAFDGHGAVRLFSGVRLATTVGDQAPQPKLELILVPLSRLRSIDLICERPWRLRPLDGIDLLHQQSVPPPHALTSSLSSKCTWLPRQDLVAAVDAFGGSVHLSDGRAISAGRAEFDAVPVREGMVREGIRSVTASARSAPQGCPSATLLALFLRKPGPAQGVGESAASCFLGPRGRRAARGAAR